MKKVKKQNKSKIIKRFFIFGFFCLLINGGILYSLVDTWNEVFIKSYQKQDLVVKLNDLKEESETLKVEVNKLQDPEYVAKYAREKYLYSGKNEYIIRIK